MIFKGSFQPKPFYYYILLFYNSITFPSICKVQFFLNAGFILYYILKLGLEALRQDRKEKKKKKILF